MTKKKEKRKFKVAGGYFLEFDQLTRVIACFLPQKNGEKVNRDILRAETGLSNRQVEGLVSMGGALGIINPHARNLTPIGQLIAEHDIFFERMGTLEWCHYKGAGSHRNLIWFETFNRVLQEQAFVTRSQWYQWFEERLLTHYKPQTIKNGLMGEIDFLIDAYLNENLRGLGLLQLAPNEHFYLQRRDEFEDLVFAAMIYDFCNAANSAVHSILDLMTLPGSPAMVFKLDETLWRRQIEILHGLGLLRYETTHDLDQIRLKANLNACVLLHAYYENRLPNN